ncbi:universal stress protein [Phytomonospora sp. NPDC050363]|uniref:universal stress protein n=1 Tax=Phytomonospora sp. NPDC050363 TaxID=3155642 RepID=UPI0033E8BDA3
MPASRPIVAGVDGSPASVAAVRYAVRLAERRRAPLHLVHASQRPAGGYDPGELVERIRAEHPGLPAVHGGQVSGAAADVLIQLGRNAEITVVGARGHGGFAGLLLGSVGHTLLRHARGPVAVVRAGGAGR